MVEAWLLADREGFAQFLGIRCNDVAANPEAISTRNKRSLNLPKSREKEQFETILFGAWARMPGLARPTHRGWVSLWTTCGSLLVPVGGQPA